MLDLLARWEARHRRGAGLDVVRGHHVHTRGLGPASLVVDLGANRGEFSSELRRLTGCRCWALEPNPDLASTIAAGDGLVVERMAIAARAGSALLVLDPNPEAHRLWNRADPPPSEVATVPVRTITVDELASAHGLERIDVLKLDVEGSELDVLESLGELAGRIGQITVEFHDFLPGFEESERIRAIRRRLRAAGFRELVASLPRGDHSDVLFLRWPGDLSRAERFHLRLLGRVVLPARRLGERLRRVGQPRFRDGGTAGE